MRAAVEVVTSSGLRQVRRPTGDLVKAVLAAEGVTGSVVVAFVDEDTITELNDRYRGLKEPTDVLTFRQADSGMEWPEPAKKGSAELGEVAICPEVVGRHALDEGGDPNTQLGWTIIHGALHLLGYDHEQDAGQMRAREQLLLQELHRQVRAVSAAGK